MNNFICVLNKPHFELMYDLWSERDIKVLKPTTECIIIAKDITHCKEKLDNFYPCIDVLNIKIFSGLGN
jgi:hypothetical protein